MKPLALYIHWPFCLSKCPYCDFNSRPCPQTIDEKKWATAYAQEIRHYAAQLPGRTLRSVYFGGGTPSLMLPETVAAVLAAATHYWPLAPACEITIEANPSAAEIEKFQAFRAAGVNRLSLGVQALDDESLRFLGRPHDAATARRAMKAAATTFDRFSFDLIYARQGHTLTAWESELVEALSFAPRHLSLYQLTIEPGTVFAKRAHRETLQADDDIAVALFERTQEWLSQAGLPAYEISNHAAPGQESQHNLAYWRYEEYVGIGPGAHGRFVTTGGCRLATANERQPEKWLKAVEKEGAGTQGVELLSEQDAMREALLMGLRLADGVDGNGWEKKFGQPMSLFLPPEKTQPLIEGGMLVWRGPALCATAAGRQRLDALLARLV